MVDERAGYFFRNSSGSIPCLAKYCPEGPFRHISRMIRNGGVSVCILIEPDFVTPGGLPVKNKSKFL